MILSKKFVSDYIDLPEDIKDVAEDMTRVGNEYDYSGKFINATNLIIGEVIECDMHPESDHLHVCKINVGSEVLDIVCGAPNMRKGIKVIVAMDGAILPGGVIKKSTIRGAVSNGMCCSIAELGLDKKFLKPEDEEGIHELPMDAPVGGDPLEYLELDDEIVDFELTSNRSDLLSMIGMAYELGAIYDRKVKEPKPEFKTLKDNFESDVTLSVDTPNCSLFLLGRAMDVTIKESPAFIKNRLMASGIRTINNVVDISNYVMLETGQPLHFYDADKVGNFIGVRMAKSGENLKTLDNQDRALTELDIVIYNKSEALGLAGVMGGFDTEISETTKNILIESAIFDAASVRKTAKRILRSEASSRFEKGLDKARTYLAMLRSKELLEKYADAKISEFTHEYNPNKLDEKHVLVSLEKINSVLGMELNINDVKEVFRKLGFSSEEKDGVFNVNVPSRRLDINIKEDLIEEVGRIYGVDNVPAKLPVAALTPGHIDKYNRDIKVRLSSLGLNEVITYSLINSKDVNKFVKDEVNNIKVLEPMTEEKSVLRYSLVSSLIEVYQYNKARNNKDISIFEIGKSYFKKGEEYIEEEKLAILMSGEYIRGINTKINIDFYYLKGIIENTLDYLGYANRYDFTVQDKIKELHPYQSADIIVSGKCVGFIGKVNPSILKDDLYVAEINLTLLREFKTGKMKYREVSKFPGVKKDLSFVFDKNITSKDIINDIKKNSNKSLVNVEVYDEYMMDNEKSLTFTLTFQDESRTLTEEEVMEVFNKVIDVITNKYNAKLKTM